MTTHSAKVVIIGSGPAGYTAAIYAARAMLEPVLFEGIQPGGQLTITTDVENYPGFADPIQGPWLMEQMRAQAGHVGTKIIADHVNSLDLSRRPFRMETESGDTWLADVVILATGAQARWLGLESEAAFRGFGVSACATCDGFFYRNKDVIVVGGGNSAAQILAEVSTVADATWVTLRPPRFLPDDVDGRVLFDVSTRRQIALRAGHSDPGGVTALGDIVITLGVRAGRDRGALARRPMFDRLTPTGVAWADGREQAADTIIWCTGFRPDLDHLAPLALDRTDGIPRTAGTRSVDEPRLHLLGYGDWTGAASATLIGAARTAKGCVTELLHHLRAGSPAQ